MALFQPDIAGGTVAQFPPEGRVPLPGIRSPPHPGGHQAEDSGGQHCLVISPRETPEAKVSQGIVAVHGGSKLPRSVRSSVDSWRF